MSYKTLLQAVSPIVVNRDKLINSYGIKEQLSGNKDLFKEILDTLTAVCKCDYAYISLLGDTEQITLSHNGEDMGSIPVDESFCKHTLDANEVCIITKAQHLENVHPFFKDFELYAGYPMVNKDDINVGSLCVVSTKAVHLEEYQVRVMKMLSEHLMETLDNQRGLIGMIKKINSNFKPAACSNLNCLRGELDHLQTEVVSQKEQLEIVTEQLKLSNKGFERFAHVVAHDFKAPVRTIISFAQIVKDKIKSNESNHDSNINDYVKYIETAGKNLDELVSSVLVFSEMKSSVSDHVPVSLSEVLSDVLINLHEEITSKKAIVTVEQNDTLVSGYKVQLVQLFQNFISNSLKYQKKNNRPEVQVHITLKNNKQIIEIKDNGIGMEEKDILNVFEPFTRLHNNSEYQGSGIGLATCKVILDNHNSVISIESKVDVGTKITFSLPACEVN